MKNSNVPTGARENYEKAKITVDTEKNYKLIEEWDSGVDIEFHSGSFTDNMVLKNGISINLKTGEVKKPKTNTKTNTNRNIERYI